MPNQENGEVRPAPVETPGKKEILGRNRAGLQAALLLDGLMPQPGLSLERELGAVKDTLDQGKHPTLARTTKSSLTERDAYWKQDEFKKFTSDADRRSEWEKNTDKFLGAFSGKDKREEAAILNRIGTRGGSAIYEEFFIRERGEIGYFAKKVAGELSQEEITKHIGLIQTVGKIYGQNSAEIARHLTEAVKNVKYNYKEFEEEASRQFSPSMDGLDVLKGIEERALAWEENEKVAQPKAASPPTQDDQAAAEPVKQPDVPEQDQAAERPFVVRARGATENKTVVGQPMPNQDAYFVDEKNGSFGVFDGVGSLRMSKEVAEAARSLTENGFANSQRNITLNEARDEVLQTMKTVAEQLGQKESERFHAMLADVKRNANSDMTDEDFDETYAPPRRTRSWAEWTKRQLNGHKKDGINEELRDFIYERIEGSTTASIVKIWQGPQDDRTAIVANVGDSRVYHYSADNRKLKIVTVDDDILNKLVGDERAMQIQEAEAAGIDKRDFLKGETFVLKQTEPLHREAWEQSGFDKRYPWGPNGQVEVPLAAIDSTVVIKTFPSRDVEPTIWEVPVRQNDRLIIVSDGVYKAMRMQKMEEILTEPENHDAGKAAQALVQSAKGVDDFGDDTTAVVIDL